MAPGHPAVAFGECDHAHGDAVLTHVNVGMEVVDGWQLADRLHEPGGCREGPGSEVRVRAVAQHAPVLDALGLTELLRTDSVGHAEPPLSPNIVAKLSV